MPPLAAAVVAHPFITAGVAAGAGALASQAIGGGGGGGATAAPAPTGGFGGPGASPAETMSPEEQRILAAQAGRLEALLPLEQAQSEAIMPLQTAFTQQTLPLTTQELTQTIPQIGALERAQMGAQQELLPAQTAFQQARLELGQLGATGQPLPGIFAPLGTEFGAVPDEQGFLQRTVIDPVLKQQEAIGFLPSGATAELTQQGLQQRAIASMTQKRQELMNLLQMVGRA